MAHARRYILRVKTPAFWQNLFDPRVIEALLPDCHRFSRLDEREYEGIYALPSEAEPDYASIWAVIQKEGDSAEVELQVSAQRKRMVHATIHFESLQTTYGMRLGLTTVIHFADPAHIDGALALLDDKATTILWRLERVATGGTFHSSTMRVNAGKPVWAMQASLGLSRGLGLVEDRTWLW